MVGVNIRKAEKTDAVKIYELMQQEAAEKNAVLPPHLTCQVFVEGGWAPTSVLVAFVAEQTGAEGQLEGYILANRSYSPWLARSMAIKEVYVTPSARGSDVALLLHQALFQAALSMGCERFEMNIAQEDTAETSLLVDKLGAINITESEGWHYFSLDSNVVMSVMDKYRREYNGSIRVRPAVPEDMDDVMVMIQELADYEKMSQSPKTNAEILRRDSPPVGTFFECFVAEKDQALVGYAMFYPTFCRQGHGMCLEDFYVRPAYRGQSVGTALMAQVAQRGIDLGGSRLGLIVLSWNTPSIAFYKHRGGTDLTDATPGEQMYRIPLSAMKKCVQ